MSESVYLNLLMNIHDFERYFKEYLGPTVAQFEEYGAELVAAGKPEVIEGDHPANWAAIVRFPNKGALEHWYESPDYRPLKKARYESISSKSDAAIIPAFKGLEN
jgi:uncharacterized protein (DUF1330 family)